LGLIRDPVQLFLGSIILLLVYRCLTAEDAKDRKVRAKPTALPRHKAMTGVWIAEKMGVEDIHILGRGCERHESFAGRNPATVLTVDRIYSQPNSLKLCCMLQGKHYLPAFCFLFPSVIYKNLFERILENIGLICGVRHFISINQVQKIFLTEFFCSSYLIL
jgi:hypothetical protein